MFFGGTGGVRYARLVCSMRMLLCAVHFVGSANQSRHAGMANAAMHRAPRTKNKKKNQKATLPTFLPGFQECMKNRRRDSICHEEYVAAEGL